MTARWSGLLPLLDAGEAIDIALDWCDKALSALVGPTNAVLTNALAHHFMTGTPSGQQLAAISTRMQAVRNRINALPDNFQWTRGLTEVSQTVPVTLTEIGDDFSNLNGPNGRAAILIHEAVHFTFTGGLSVDVPEWSGAIINGVPFGISPPVANVTVSGIGYSAMTPDQAIENPSSYAAFAQEITFNGTDTRFGAARPHE
jgi:hypothetical protein